MRALKKSDRWIGIFIVYTLIVFLGFLFTRILLGSDLSMRYILGFILISMVFAIIPSVGGFLGKQMFFYIYTLAIVIGIFYMFYVVFANTGPGWGDLTSIVGDLFIVGVGTVLALIVEVIYTFVKKGKRTKV